VNQQFNKSLVQQFSGERGKTRASFPIRLPPLFSVKKVGKSGISMILAVLSILMDGSYSKTWVVVLALRFDTQQGLKMHVVAQSSNNQIYLGKKSR